MAARDKIGEIETLKRRRGPHWGLRPGGLATFQMNGMAVGDH